MASHTHTHTSTYRTHVQNTSIYTVIQVRIDIEGISLYELQGGGADAAGLWVWYGACNELSIADAVSFCQIRSES